MTLHDQGIYFTREVGRVDRALALWSTIPVSSRVGLTAAQSAGLNYEAKVFEHLEVSGELFLAHLPFSFHSGSRVNRIIPDGVMVSRTRAELYIVEVKLRHTAEAYHQLQFYSKIIAKAFPSLKIRRLEVVKYYNPAVILPEPKTVTDNYKAWLENGKTDYAVYIWSGR